MSVSLGAIPLNANLRLVGVRNQPSMAGSARITIGGVCIQRIGITGGKAFQLVAVKDGNSVYGYFTGEQLTAIEAIRDAGDPVILEHHIGTWRVWLPPDALNVEQTRAFANPSETSRYIGTITLITVA